MGGRVQNHDVTFDSEVGHGTFHLRGTDTIALLCHCWLSHELVTASTVAMFIAGDETYWKRLGIRAQKVPAFKPEQSESASPGTWVALQALDQERRLHRIDPFQLGKIPGTLGLSEDLIS